MDVMKLFDNYKQEVPPLAAEKIDAMIEQALAYPQINRPANQNAPWLRKALAVAAALALVVGMSLQLSPTTSSGSDAYDEISDLLILETLSDLS